MTFGSLFSGIGGIDLGLQRAGMSCEWQVEINPFCRKVLGKHWPEVRKHDDVCNFPAGNPDEWRVDLVAGGFPCQDISGAGKREGIGGKRSGLWAEFHRIICVLRPEYVLVENVSALLVRGMGRVLGDLASIGYDAEWDCLPAHIFGADHARTRVFIVGSRVDLLYANRERREELHAAPEPGRPRILGGPVVPHGSRWATTQPPVCGRDDGIPSRVDRLRGCGNSVVPRVAEWIGRQLVSHHSGNS